MGKTRILGWRPTGGKNIYKSQSRGKFLLIAAMLLIPVAFAAKENLTHDEALSVLAASCRQEEFSQMGFSRPTGSELTEYLKPDSFMCVLPITTGLLRTDVHPPAYFVLLHVFLAFLAPVHSIIVVNLLFLYTGVYYVIRLSDALKIKYGPFLALLFVLSPTVINTAYTGRPYMMLTAVALGFTYYSHRFLNKRQDAAKLVFFFVTGLLTSPIFSLFSLPFLALFVKRNRALAALLGSVLILNAGLFLGQFLRVSQRGAEEYNPLLAVVLVVKSFANIVAPTHLYWLLINFPLVLFAMVPIAVLVAFTGFAGLRKTDPVLTAAIIGACMPLALFILNLVPQHTIYSRFRAILVPYLLLLIPFRKKGLYLAVVLFAVSALGQFTILSHLEAHYNNVKADNVIQLEAPTRGYLLMAAHNFMGGSQALCIPECNATMLTREDLDWDSSMKDPLTKSLRNQPASWKNTRTAPSTQQ